jgi:hypothetical protein
MRLGRSSIGDAGRHEPLSRRRLLLRDTSVVLMVVGLLFLMAGQLPSSGAPTGEQTTSPGDVVGVLPSGSLDLLGPTPDETPPSRQTPTPKLDVTRATLPPWCGNAACTFFATHSPSPTPSASLTVSPVPTPTPAASPTASPTPAPTPTPDITPPPDPTITSGPADGDTTATFFFSDAEAGVTFACWLDGSGYATCSSGVGYSVGNGSHTFRVTASDAASNTSGATMWSWIVPAPTP